MARWRAPGVVVAAVKDTLSFTFLFPTAQVFYKTDSTDYPYSAIYTATMTLNSGGSPGSQTTVTPHMAASQVSGCSSSTAEVTGGRSPRLSRPPSPPSRFACVLVLSRLEACQTSLCCGVNSGVVQRCCAAVLLCAAVLWCGWGSATQCCPLWRYSARRRLLRP
jgi:hypothetical protein